MPSFIGLPLLASLGWLWTTFLAVPIWLLWSVCGLDTRLFGFLPAVWRSLSLLDTVALMLTFAIVRTALSPMKFELKVSGMRAGR